MDKLTKDIFYQRSILIHGDKYDYSKVIYSTCTKRVVIICHKHGIFNQTPSSHLSGHGCPKCARELSAAKRIRNCALDFIEKAMSIHGDRYDYKDILYINAITKVDISCRIHGIFSQSPHAHLYGEGCPYCARSVGDDVNLIKDKTYQKEHFILISNNTHGNKYDYSLVNYVNSRTKVKIICPLHGIFEQTPSSHSTRSGCPVCRSSVGERKIMIILSKYNIIFERQKKFNKCRYKHPLPFDFYIPLYNIIIEYHGSQHFKPTAVFGGEVRFKDRLITDSIKEKWAIDNDYLFLKYTYKDKWDYIEDNILYYIKNNNI